MMRKGFIILLVAVILAVWLYVLTKFVGSFTFECVVIASIFSLMTFIFFGAIREIIWRLKNGADLFASLETDPKKVKEHMLFIMQYHGIEEGIKELNVIFRNYPQWELTKWNVFRAWYKHTIDRIIRTYGVTSITYKDGTQYTTAGDKLYDPDAPAWEKFDRYNTSSLYDDDDYYDEYKSKCKCLKDDAKDGFLIGIGFGVASDIINDSSHIGTE